MIDVIGVGANSIDHVVRIPGTIDDVTRSGKVRVLEEQWFCGGQTATTMAACSVLGLRASYVGAFGDDEHGARIGAELAHRNVDVSHCVIRRVRNAGATIVVDSTGRRTVFWQRDEALALRTDEIDADTLRQSRLIHVDDVDGGAALYACRVARAAGVRVTSDIERVTDGTEELVGLVTHPVFDHNAPLLLTGEADPERALRKLRRLNSGLLCMTLGDRGAAALEGDMFYLVPARTIDAVDTTAAGDVFRAAYIYGLLQAWQVPVVLAYSNAAAAASCMKPGAMSSIPTHAEIEANVRSLSS
jgi:sugar/nucleoside kinase (ribokinase family)